MSTNGGPTCEDRKRWYDRSQAVKKFEREHIRKGLKLADEPAPPEPPRYEDFDVSGADGIRYVVIPCGLPPRLYELDGRPGWSVFDTLFKARVGLMRTTWARAWDDCRYFNAHEEAV